MKVNFFKRFLPFLDEIFNSMMPMFQFDPLSLGIMGGLGLLGGLAGAQGGQPQTQTVQYLPPQYTPQQQAINNMMYYGIMQNLMQPQSPYADILNQYIYGTPAASTQATTPTGGLPTAKEAIQQYETMKAQVAEEERPYKEQARDVRTEVLAPVYKAAQDAARQRKNPYDIPEFQSALTDVRDKIGALTGLTAEEANNWIKAMTWKGIQDEIGEYPNLSQKIYLTKISPGFSNEQVKGITEGTDFSEVYKGIAEVPEEKSVTQQLKEFGAMEEKPVKTEQPAAGEEVPTTTGGLLGQMPTAEQIAGQFGLIKERGMEDIAKWYQQAQRELEQRGISQYGGYMGTPFERDIGGILSKRGELQETLGRELGVAQSSAQTQNWYDMLQALGNLQTLQSNIQTQQMTPWLGAAQSMTAVPYGQTATTSAQPAGFIPGFLGGVYGGAGLMESISNWNKKSSYPGLEV